MTTPAPRPALKKSADAHIHPAAPGHPRSSLQPAADQARGSAEPESGSASAPPDGQSRDPGDPTQHRLSGPLRGNTSDSLRNATRKARRRPKATSSDKLVKLDVKVPKSVRKEFSAAVKADKKDPDAVVTALLKAWLST